MFEILKHEVEVIPLSALRFFTRLVLPSNGFLFFYKGMHPYYTRLLFIPLYLPPLQISVFKNGKIECAIVSHFLRFVGPKKFGLIAPPL